MSWVLELERRIPAPAGAVWSVLTDLAAYREWNPWVTEVEGTLAEGRSLTLRVPVLGVPWRVRVRVVEFGPASFTWDLVEPVPGILRARRCQSVEPDGAGACTYVSRETFSGPAAGLVERTTASRLRVGLAAMADALAARTLERSGAPCG